MNTTDSAGDRTASHADTETRARHDVPHRGYVCAVQTDLASRGFVVTVGLIGGVAIWHADLELRTEDRGLAVLLRWDELNGWSCQIRGAFHAPAIAFDAAVVPPPTQLADWVESVLRHPSVRPRRVAGPFVTRDLTAQLERYGTGAE